MSHCRWFVALVVLAGVAVPAFGQDKALLKWKFEKDKPFYQKLTTETEQNMKVMGSDIKQKQKQIFYFSWTPLKEEADGGWVIKQKIEGVEMNIDIGGNTIKYDSTKADATTANPLGDFFKQLVGSEFTLTLNKDMKVTKIEGREDFIKKLTAVNPQMEALLKQILSEEALKEMADPTFGALPNKEVAKGDTWTRESKLNMGPIGKYENTYKYTYEGKEKDLDKIKVETTLKYTAPGDTASTGGLPFKIKSAELTPKNAGGELFYSAAEGRVVNSTLNVTLEGKLSIEIGGQTTEVSLSQTQKTTSETSKETYVKKAS